MSAGYSGTPLVRKLGLKPGMRVRLLGEPPEYWTLLGGSPEALEVRVLAPRGSAAADFQHVFARDAATLSAGMTRARRAMERDGMVWVSWPKGSAVPDAPIGRSEVMAAGKAAGLVDVKVCAVDDTWSALKFVIPVADR